MCYHMVTLGSYTTKIVQIRKYDFINKNIENSGFYLNQMLQLKQKKIKGKKTCYLVWKIMLHSIQRPTLHFWHIVRTLAEQPSPAQRFLFFPSVYVSR